MRFLKITCNTLKTTVNLNKKVLNKQKEFEIELQKFGDPMAIFYPDLD